MIATGDETTILNDGFQIYKKCKNTFRPINALEKQIPTKSINNEKICQCVCHVDNGNFVRHIIPCCEFTYEKYLNKDFSVNYEKYNELKANENTTLNIS
jgi:hypothetical protein